MTQHDDDLPEEWHNTYDEEQHGWQRLVDEIDAMIWFGKWAGIALLIAVIWSIFQ